MNSFACRHCRGLLAAVLLLSPTVAFAQGPPPTLVVVDEVSEIEFHEQITLVGRTEANIHGDIVAEASGRVISIDAPEGRYVRRGDPLVTIDSARFVLASRAKQAEAEQAKQQAFLAGQNLKRIQELYGQQLVPESTIDSAKAWSISAQALYQQLRAESDQMALDLENCIIRAPYSGYTLRRSTDVGAWVNPGTPVYAMVSLATITVRVDLPERYYGQVAIGSEVGITTTNDENEVIVGEVSGIARSASAETHTFPVIVKVPNPDGKLGGGKLVRARLNLESSFTSLAVHKDAIMRNGAQTMVYTIAEGKAAPIPVEISSTSGELVAVSSQELQKGMPVVIRGNERIFPGAPVTTGDQKEAATQSAAGSELSAATNE